MLSPVLSHAAVSRHPCHHRNGRVSFSLKSQNHSMVLPAPCRGKLHLEGSSTGTKISLKWISLSCLHWFTDAISSLFLSFTTNVIITNKQCIYDTIYSEKCLILLLLFLLLLFLFFLLHLIMLLGVAAMDSISQRKKRHFSLPCSRGSLAHDSFKQPLPMYLRLAYLAWTPKSYQTCFLRNLVKEAKLDESGVEVEARLGLPGKKGLVGKKRHWNGGGGVSRGLWGGWMSWPLSSDPDCHRGPVTESCLWWRPWEGHLSPAWSCRASPS